MDKKERKLIQYVELLKMKYDTEKMMSLLPKGYISTKTISGHTYSYLQWREGSKIVSKYIEDDLLFGVKSKIKMRKDVENLLRIIKNDIKNVKKSIMNGNYLNQEQIGTLEENMKLDDMSINKSEVLNEQLPEFVSTKLGEAYINGDIPFNRLLLIKWGLISE